MKKIIIALFVLLLPALASAQTTCVDRTGQYVLNGWKYFVQTAGTTTDKQRVAELERDGWTITGFGGNGTTIRIYAKCKVDTPPEPPQPPPLPSLSIVCPPTQTATAVDSTGVTVSFPAPTASGGVAPVTITVSPASGSKFPVGGSVVTGRAVDAANQNATCTFTVTVAPPPAPTPPPTGTAIFSNGWQRLTTLGSPDIQTLLDGPGGNSATWWGDFGPAFRTPYPTAGIVSIVGFDGAMTRALQVNFVPDGTQNGPDFRIAQNFGNRQEIWGRVRVKYSQNWVWAGADHKVVIIGNQDTSSQDVYVNVRGKSGNGSPGMIAVHVIPIDGLYEVPDSTMLINQWNLVEWHIKCGTGGMVEVKLNTVMLNLIDRTGRNPNPRNINPCSGAAGYVKLDTTYNAYSYPSGLGLTMQTWFDDAAISATGWLGGSPVTTPFGATPSGPRRTRPLGNLPPGDPASGPHRPVVRAEK